MNPPIILALQEQRNAALDAAAQLAADLMVARARIAELEAAAKADKKKPKKKNEPPAAPAPTKPETPA